MFLILSEGSTVLETPLNMHDPQILAMAAIEICFLEASTYDEYASTNASGTAFCSFVALIVRIKFFFCT